MTSETRAYHKNLQPALCTKDNNLYVYRIDENQSPPENDYCLIKCFRVTMEGKPDFSNEIEIYRKDLIITDRAPLNTFSLYIKPF